MPVTNGLLVRVKRVLPSCRVGTATTIRALRCRHAAVNLRTSSEIPYHCTPSNTMAYRSSGHVTILDPMRGVAAFAVVVFHYLGSVLPTLRPNSVEHIASYGQWGVQVFFVISGFVIPYAMQNGGYQWRDAGRFLLRRVVRIAPPAYIAALAMIVFHLLSMVINGREVKGDLFPGFGWRAIIGNLTFATDYFGTTWYNFVYWSLTAEFEFYLLIAAILPLIRVGSPDWRVALVMCAILLVPFITCNECFGYAGYFVIGMLVFLWRETATNHKLLLLLGIAATMTTVLIDGIEPTSAAILAAVVILSGTTAHSRATDFLGNISFSLYITHVPVAYFAESLLKRVIDYHSTPVGKTVMFVVYLALALLVAWVFHHYVEKPFLHMSKRIPKRRPIISPV